MLLANILPSLSDSVSLDLALWARELYSFLGPKGGRAPAWGVMLSSFCVEHLNKVIFKFKFCKQGPMRQRSMCFASPLHLPKKVFYHHPPSSLVPCQDMSLAQLIQAVEEERSFTTPDKVHKFLFCSGQSNSQPSLDPHHYLYNNRAKGLIR